MEYVVKTRNKTLKRMIEHILPSMLEQLGLKRSKKFLLIEISKHAGDGNDGMTMPLPDLDSFIVAIRPGRWHEVGVTLAHEMVHVKQLAKGQLKAENGNKFWMGRKYSKRTKYIDTPWEQEAFAKQELIFRRALEE